MIGRGDRGFVARDYWVWLIFEGLQNLVQKVEKKGNPFKGFAVVSGLLISFQHQWLVFRPDAWSNEPRSRWSVISDWSWTTRWKHVFYASEVTFAILPRPQPILAVGDFLHCPHGPSLAW
jgi:hypothetical protein